MAKNKDGVGGRGRGREKTQKITDKLVLDVLLCMSTDKGLPAWGPVRRVVKELGITLEMVNACLQRARAMGLFSVQPHVPYEVIETHTLEGRMRQQFDLKQVILVPGYVGMMDDLNKDQRRRTHTAVVRAMTPRVAALLDELVTEAKRTKTELTVSVAWGRTMRMFADHLWESRRPTMWDKLTVLPLLGPTSGAKTDPVEAHIIAMWVATAYGGSWGQMPCPAFVRAEQVKHCMELDDVKDACDRLRASRCVVTSLGPIPASADLIDVTLSRDPAMSKALADAARQAEAIGEINYWAFKANGQAAETSYQAIGLGFDGLQTLSADPDRSVVLMCGGDKHRIPALRAALTAKLCNVLVSDTVTARELLGEPQPSQAMLRSIPKEWPRK